jgi:hypothetical protein
LVLSAEINEVSIGYTKNYLGSMDLFVLKLIQFYQNHNFCEKKLPLKENKMQESNPMGSIPGTIHVPNAVEDRL